MNYNEYAAKTRKVYAIIIDTLNCPAMVPSMIKPMCNILRNKCEHDLKELPCNIIFLDNNSNVFIKNTLYSIADVVFGYMASLYETGKSTCDNSYVLTNMIKEFYENDEFIDEVNSIQ